jgi:hypothetical protein
VAPSSTAIHGMIGVTARARWNWRNHEGDGGAARKTGSGLAGPATPRITMMTTLAVIAVTAILAAQRLSLGAEAGVPA